MELCVRNWLRTNSIRSAVSGFARVLISPTGIRRRILFERAGWREINNNYATRISKGKQNTARLTRGLLNRSAGYIRYDSDTDFRAVAQLSAIIARTLRKDGISFACKKVNEKRVISKMNNRTTYEGRNNFDAFSFSYN